MRFGDFCRFDLDNPSCFSAFVGEKTEFGDVTDDRTEKIEHTAVAVATCAENGVCINDCTGFRPRKNVAFLRNVADFVEIARASECVCVFESNRFQLFFIAFLL